MPYGLSPAVIESISRVLADEPSLQRARLFGSRALGRERPGSDVDLCLEGPDLDLDSLNRIENGLEALGLPWKFDLLLWRQIDDPALKAHVDRVGRVLFERGGKNEGKVFGG